MRAGVDDAHLNPQRDRLVLLLLEQLGEPVAALELVPRVLVQVRCELGEGGQLPVLGELELHASRNLAHGLGLGVAAYA